MPCVHAVGTRASPLPALSPSPQARDVYEEAIRTVMTVRDFTQVFDSYAQFEESMIAAKMETASELGREEEGEQQGWATGLGGVPSGWVRGGVGLGVRGQQGGSLNGHCGWDLGG